ncbi:MAG: exosortase family protein XrtF [Flavobacteriaceae bacterium]|jgi:exosortase family protein XrtF|nr:exosortase family protein XrtF [Flavobacteriaceae bacterium]
MKEFKPVLIFLLKFAVTGIVLVVLYNLYLHQYHQYNLPDPYSQFVADCTVYSMNSLGFDAIQVVDKTRPWIWIGMNNEWLSYINEGCNAVSVMIIFVAFIFAFSTTWKQTLLYILGGLIIIKIMNIARIVLLNYIFAYHKEYGKIAHDYLFPAIIYGTIVVLWIIWVKYFALKLRNKSDEQVD